MRSEWLSIFATFLHLLAMAAYVGGAVVMEFVVGPAQRAIPPAQQQVMGQRTADRFLWIVWGSLALLLVSGILQTFPAYNEDMLVGKGMFDSSYGRTLFVMIALWFVLVINGAIITFVLRPKLSGRMQAATGAQRAQARTDEMMRAARQITLLSRIDLALALFLPFVGAGLIRGGGIF